MSEQVNSAAPVAADANMSSSENNEISQENQEVDASAEESAEDGEESSEESSEEGEKSAKAGEGKEKSKKKAEKELERRIKKLKLKVDGKEIEEELDLDDDERLIRELQMAKMGQKRAQEKADLEKQVRAFFDAFQKDPFAAMTELGFQPEQVIDEYINKQLEQAKKTPEQIEKERLETELQRLKSEREREKEELRAKELERLQQQEFERYDMLMEQALTKSQLPKTPYTVKKIADYMLVALEAGKDVSPEDVIPLVQEEMNSDLKEMFASLPEDTIEALLGEQVLNKLRKRRVAKAQEAQKNLPKSQIQDTGKSVKGEAKTKEKLSYKDLFGF
jgi:hypothetical protein